MKRSSSFAVVVGLLGSVGCSPATPDYGERAPDTARVIERVAKLSTAYCSVQVKGKGKRDMELDYLPHVIACENNGAGLEALKAQAIAARSVAYYEMATNGSICDSQGCQVYSCSNKPGPLHYQAVGETAQQYLAYASMLTYAFYVAGDSSVSGPSCIDSGGTTTKYITYNDGKSGKSVTQTKLGYVGPPGFGQNRGCMGQWGARCLESSGRDAHGILRFYYGADIEVVTAPGSCPAPPGGKPPAPSPEPEPEPTPAPDPDPSPAPAAGASCAGLCGAQAPQGCYCDADCAGYGDCCADYASVCGGGGSPPSEPTPPPQTPPPGSGASCVGFCGSSSPVPGGSCYCDDSCETFGDCCADFVNACY
ncbi:MAG: hypothetical protein KF718_26210 [Polyangiaceae bacterium]|nr:hypothetical protein [Polyangiaceae bacterium]